jgi:hypothetical protein
MNSDKFSNYINSNKKKNNCITKCYPEKTLYYHPILLEPMIITKYSTCATYDPYDNMKVIDFCNLKRY